MAALAPSMHGHTIHLEQGWQLATAPAGSQLADIDGLLWQDAEVPGTAASSLRALGQWSFETTRDFDAMDWWWRVDFQASAGTAVLGFDGLATLAEVCLDRELLLVSDNMFRAHQLTLTLTAGSHQLLIHCRALDAELRQKRPRARWRVPMLVKQQLRWFRTTLLGRTPGWSPPCAAVGPWRPVWLRQGAAAIDAVQIKAGLHEGCGTIELSAMAGAGVEQASLTIECNGTRHSVALHTTGARLQGELQVPDAHLWWPHTHGTPTLYQAWIDYQCGAQDGRHELTPIGFRSIELDQANDDFRLSVNGVDVFCRGACWTPLDAVSLNATPEAYDDAVAQMCAAGMNMLRIGGTMVYEDDALYAALDRHGILLWQDLMFANMDYPDDDAFVAEAQAEVAQQLKRLQPHACLALVCGNSEGEQQAAMSAAPRELWSPQLFHQNLAQQVAAHGFHYTPSSAHGGAFPHAANAGPSSYYGVGAYLRPLADARCAELRFASECLAFANLPDDRGLPSEADLRVHHPLWKIRSPRDLGAGWDFDDVRDHYLARLFGIDPNTLRVSDHARYLALGRAVTGEVMARAFAEWRRARSPTRGALVWFLRDLWPGTGWGVLGADGRPKSCWYALRRTLASRAVSISDEGVNGLVIHLFNDHAQAWNASLAIDLYRAGDVRVGHGTRDFAVPAHTSIEIPASDLFEGFLDLSFAYRFGPAMFDVLHASVHDTGHLCCDSFHFPAGLPTEVVADVGLTATPAGTAKHPQLLVSSQHFAQSVEIDTTGLICDDNGFHLAPGQQRTVNLTRQAGARHVALRGQVAALNSARHVRFRLA